MSNFKDVSMAGGTFPRVREVRDKDSEEERGHKYSSSREEK